MSRGAFAFWTLLVSVALGFAGNIFFYDQFVGASFPLFVSLMVVAVLGSGLVARREINARNLWPILPALFFALFVAVRADDNLTFLNGVAVLTLAGLALHYLGVSHPLDKESTGSQAANFIAMAIRTSTSEPIITLVEAGRWANNRDLRGGKTVFAVARGLLFAIPVLVVFGVLLASADAVFAAYLDAFGGIFAFHLEHFIPRLMLTGFLAWVVAGAITYGVARGWYSPRQRATETDDTPSATAEDLAEQVAADTEGGQAFEPAADAPPPTKRTGGLIKLGMIEGVMVLGSLDLMFGAFVLVQAVYLFGGAQALDLGGLSYAEYARRGFMELVVVSILTIVLLLAMDSMIVRDGRRQQMFFRGLSLVMVALSGAILISAARRMGLYTDVFGYTRLRVWVLVFFPWAAVTFAFLVAGLFRVRTNIFSLGLLVVSIGHLATVNFINVDAFIVSNNIDRHVDQGADLDLCYARRLSEDAVPELVQFYQMAETDQAREEIGRTLATFEPAVARYEREDSVFGYNRGMARAEAALGKIDVSGYAPYSAYEFSYGCVISSEESSFSR